MFDGHHGADLVLILQVLAIPLILGLLLGICALGAAGVHSLRGGPAWYGRLIVRNAVLGAIALTLAAGVIGIATDFLLVAVWVAAAELPLGFLLPPNVAVAFGLSGSGWLALATATSRFRARNAPTTAPV